MAGDNMDDTVFTLGFGDEEEIESELRATIARLERERDEARLNLTLSQSETAEAWAIVLGERGHVNALNSMYQEIVAERDAARDDAARMRLALEAAMKELTFYKTTEKGKLHATIAQLREALEAARDWWNLGHRSCEWCMGRRGEHLPNCPGPQVDAALALDDGWLARRIEEAVEPYRAFVRDWLEGDGVGVEAARALLGDTPTKEGE